MNPLLALCRFLSASCTSFWPPGQRREYAPSGQCQLPTRSVWPLSTQVQSVHVNKKSPDLATTTSSFAAGTKASPVKAGFSAGLFYGRGFINQILIKENQHQSAAGGFPLPDVHRNPTAPPPALVNSFCLWIFLNDRIVEQRSPGCDTGKPITPCRSQESHSGAQPGCPCSQDWLTSPLLSTSLGLKWAQPFEVFITPNQVSDSFILLLPVNSVNVSLTLLR